jgi:hypothetical protein
MVRWQLQNLITRTATGRQFPDYGQSCPPDDALLLNPGEKIKGGGVRDTADLSTSPDAMLSIAQAGLYQNDVHCAGRRGVCSLETRRARFLGNSMNQSGDAKEPGKSPRRSRLLVCRLGAQTNCPLWQQQPAQENRAEQVADDSKPGKRFRHLRNVPPCSACILACGATAAAR